MSVDFKIGTSEVASFIAGAAVGSEVAKCISESVLVRIAGAILGGVVSSGVSLVAKSYIGTQAQPVNSAEISTTKPIKATTLRPPEYSLLKGWKKYVAVLVDNQREEVRELIIPERRVCGFGGMESQRTIDLAKRTVFVTDEEILKVHSMRFLGKSPFVKHPDLLDKWDDYFRELDDNAPEWTSIFDTLIDKNLHAIALTEDGKHVILQQAVKSCVPTCVAMLVLDHGKTPNYKAIRVTNLANETHAISWVKEAGLTPKMTELKDTENKADILIDCLKKHGSGVLAITHPLIGGHVIILDEISKKDNTAVIRDSFQGRVLTIKLDALLSWMGPHEYFLQIDNSGIS